MQEDLIFGFDFKSVCAANYSLRTSICSCVSLAACDQLKEEDSPLCASLLLQTAKLKSAAAPQWGLDWLITTAGEVALDPRIDQLHMDQVRASDEATMTHFTRGLSARIGTASKPAVPLLEGM